MFNLTLNRNSIVSLSLLCNGRTNVGTELSAVQYSAIFTRLGTGVPHPGAGGGGDGDGDRGQEEESALIEWLGWPGADSILGAPE